MISDSDVAEPVPQSVSHLDELLHRQVLVAQTDDELNTALRNAVRVKKQVASVVPSAVDAEARAALVRLENEIKK